MTNQYRMTDTSRPDGCYVSFELIEHVDQDASPMDYLFQDPEYKEQDQARYEAWLRDEWHFIGIQARAHVLVVANRVGTMLELVSPGLWGIESDSGEDYLAEVFSEECESLKSAIARMANPTFE
jgi:hypothetical protein